jgi:hypothetical protein
MISPEHARFYDTLSPAEKECLHLYKTNAPFGGEMCFTYTLNSRLLSGQPLPPPWENKAVELDHIVTKYAAPHKITLYRAMFETVKSPIWKGRTVTYPAYLSTASTEQTICAFFTEKPTSGIIPVELVVECQEGTPMAPMEADGRFGNDECEYLLGRGTEYKIVSVQEIDSIDEIQNVMGYHSDGFQCLRRIKLATGKQ